MFKFFKKDVDEFTLEEKEMLIKEWLYKTDSLCSSYEYNRTPYKIGGTEALEKLISDLTFILLRIKELETADIITERQKFLEIYNGKKVDKS